MKIAIATDSGYVCEHFGRSPEFTIVDIKNFKVVDKKVVENPGHSTGSIPKFMHALGVKRIIAGGMGWRATEFLEQFGIKAVIGVSGRVDDVIDELIKGTLKGGKSFCTPHGGRGYGVDKEDSHHD